MSDTPAERRAWHMALVGLSLHAFGNLLNIFFEAGELSSGLQAWRIVNATTSISLIAALLVRRSPPVWASTAAVVVACAVTLPMLWTKSAAHLAEGWSGIPFAGLRMLVLLVPLLVPGPPWVSVAIILVVASQMVAQAWWFDWSEGRSIFPEPWSSLTIAVIALVVVAYRVRWERAEAAATRARQRAESLERQAQLALAARELQNTPLQTLQLGLAAFERGRPVDDEALARMKRAVMGLRELSALLDRYDRVMPWAKNHLAFDARRRLEQLSADLPADEREGRRATNYRTD